MSRRRQKRMNQVTVGAWGHHHVIVDIVAKAGILNLIGWRDGCRPKAT